MILIKHEGINKDKYTVYLPDEIISARVSFNEDLKIRNSMYIEGIEYQYDDTTNNIVSNGLKKTFYANPGYQKTSLVKLTPPYKEPIIIGYTESGTPIYDYPEIDYIEKIVGNDNIERRENQYTYKTLSFIDTNFIYKGNTLNHQDYIILTIFKDSEILSARGDIFIGDYKVGYVLGDILSSKDYALQYPSCIFKDFYTTSNIQEKEILIKFKIITTNGQENYEKTFTINNNSIEGHDLNVYSKGGIFT